MPQLLDSRVVEWRDADARARAAEQALGQFPFGQGEPPPSTANLAMEARALRRKADEKLKAALVAMHRGR